MTDLYRLNFGDYQYFPVLRLESSPVQADLIMFNHRQLLYAADKAEWGIYATDDRNFCTLRDFSIEDFAVPKNVTS